MAVGGKQGIAGRGMAQGGAAWSRCLELRFLIVAAVCASSMACASAAVANTSGFRLPDGRTWEMVSPPNKHGAGLEPIADEGSVIQAAANGNALTYVATGPISSHPAGNRAVEYSQAIAHRTADGWVSGDIATQHEEVAHLEVGSQVEYKFFSEDLSYGLAEPPGETPLPPLESGAEKTLYRRDDGNGTYLPLVTKANVRAGAVFGDEAAEDTLTFVDATPDLAHVALASTEALTAAYPGSSNSEKDLNLYEWSNGVLGQVNVLPDGKTTVEEKSGGLHPRQ